MSREFLKELKDNKAFSEMITDVKKNKYIQIVIARASILWYIYNRRKNLKCCRNNSRI